MVLWGEGSRVPPQLAALDARVVKVAAGGIETGDFIALLSNGSVRAWRYGERANASATAAAPPAGSLWCGHLCLWRHLPAMRGALRGGLDCIHWWRCGG